MAINKNELRFGNYLLYQGIYIVSVDSIGNYGFTCNGDEVHPPDNFDIEPIILTGDWIRKFGFKRYAENKYLIGHQDFTYHLTHRSLNGFKDGGYFMGIRYDDWDDDPNQVFTFEASKGNIMWVHQLQNLYFALTGIELVLSAGEKV